MELQDLSTIDDPVKRRALFVGLLSREVEKLCDKSPIVVGGQALEIYTQGGYTTGDIYLKGPKDCIETVLKGWNFQKKTNLWFNPELDIYIDGLGETLEEGPEAEARTNTIVLDEALKIRVLSIEDLIIDRLNTAKWWNDTDSLMWAEVLVRVKEATGQALDIDYLRKRAKEEELEVFLKKILKDR